jgi:pimeloyl-ACP methyl ester carboxylesterase
MKRLLVGIVGGAGVLVAATAVVFVALRGRTPAIRDAAGRPVTGSIARLERVRLGGVDQSILIRGADSTRPIVLFLHGGPGMPAMFLAHAFQGPLERDFVVVQWDRRGAGKSYAARWPAESLTVRRTLNDLYELTMLLRIRFRRRRIDLVAHSWGTLLGLVAVREHPEWYRLYVGMGQVVPDTARGHATQRAEVLARARRLGDTSLVRRLSTPGAVATENDLFRVGGELRGATSFWPILRTGLSAPEYTLWDAWNVRRGASLLQHALQPDPVARLPVAGDTLFVPLFLFLGRDDLNTPSDLAARYLQTLHAPRQTVVWFERSAHFPFFEEPDRFAREMVRADAAAQRYWMERRGRTARPVSRASTP